MCGIIGYTGAGDAMERVLSGLHALEYRGYDSAGVSFFDGDAITTIKAQGKIVCVEEKIRAQVKQSTACAIGHTRWATHGAPSDSNSHPHGTARVRVVHNGIIENYRELRDKLTALGYNFESETDTEAAALWIDHYYRETGDPMQAIRLATADFRGAYALGILFAGHAGVIYAIRKDNPLIVGAGVGESFIASDITAFLKHTRSYYQPDNGELAVVTADAIAFYDPKGNPITKDMQTANWDISAAERGGYPHFMLKEIHEEPEVLQKTLLPRIGADGLPDFSADGLDDARFAHSKTLHIVACGTALHAGMYAKWAIEKYARVPVQVEIASEFRYADPILSEKDTVIVISQSGETADTLAALRLANQAGAYTVGIVNVVGSTIARECDATVYTRAGAEIAVASTKAYTVQTALLLLLAMKLALLTQNTEEAEVRSIVHALTEALPSHVEVLAAREAEILEIARAVYESEDLFFLGRNADYYLAMEASLKLKEISYIHSEAYAAGELKHGTISLIEEGTPVIALSTVKALEEKMVSNVKEVCARGAAAYGFAFCGAAEMQKVTKQCFLLPEMPDAIAPIAMATALQLLAYHCALLRGCDVDQPRNLAKSVTVE